MTKKYLLYKIQRSKTQTELGIGSLMPWPVNSAPPSTFWIQPSPSSQSGASVLPEFLNQSIMILMPQTGSSLECYQVGFGLPCLYLMNHQFAFTGENVCTENLTPWKKLLPCGGKRGLATLLNADHIHVTKYHSLGLTMRLICSQHASFCQEPLIELSQYVVLVFDPITMPDNVRAAEAEQRGESSWSNWSIRSLFGIGITSACPIAETSKIYIDKTTDSFDIIPDSPSEEIKLKNGGRDVTSFDVRMANFRTTNFHRFSNFLGPEINRKWSSQLECKV